MNLIVYVNNHYEEEKALFNLDTNEVILFGNHYDNKIDYKIWGYLMALREHGIYNNTIKIVCINSSHEHFDLIGFYK